MDPNIDQASNRVGIRLLEGIRQHLVPEEAIRTMDPTAPYSVCGDTPLFFAMQKLSAYCVAELLGKPIDGSILLRVVNGRSPVALLARRHVDSHVKRILRMIHATGTLGTPVRCFPVYLCPCFHQDWETGIYSLVTECVRVRNFPLATYLLRTWPACFSGEVFALCAAFEVFYTQVQHRLPDDVCFLIFDLMCPTHCTKAGCRLYDWKRWWRWRGRERGG